MVPLALPTPWEIAWCSLTLVSSSDSREASGVRRVRVCVWLAMDPDCRHLEMAVCSSHWSAGVWMQLGSVWVLWAMQGPNSSVL